MRGLEELTRFYDDFNKVYDASVTTLIDAL